MELTLTSLAMTVIVTILVMYIFLGKKRKNLPPGPRPLPILGNILEMPPNVPLYKTLTAWAEEYGPIYTIQIGSDTSIILNDAKLIREALLHPAFNGRPTNKVFLAISDGEHGESDLHYELKGVISSDGDVWSEQRRFTLRHLRNFGFGKTSMESLIRDEAKELVETFQKENGNPFDPSKRFSLAVLNSLWFIVTGSRFSQDDTEIQGILQAYFTELDEVFVTGYLSAFPILADIAPEWSGFNKLKGTMKKASDFFMNIILEHEKTMDENEPRDFIDAYLAEIKKANDSSSSSFNRKFGYKNLLATIGDFFAAGAETTATTLCWSVLYLSVFPDTQKRLQEEIDRVIGQGLPSLLDRPNMPYAEALILEIFRKSSIAPVGLFHRATRDATLAGYDIPQNAFIIPHFHRVHHNPKDWTDPSAFSPDRFLVRDPQGNLTVLKSENLIPFSVGRRACLGESLARDEFFLFLIMIYQSLSTQLDPRTKDVSLEPQTTFIDRPFPYRVIMTNRKF